MKGKYESVIPQRQFENIHVSYEFTNEVEQKEAEDKIISDMLRLHHEVSRRAAEAINENIEIGNVQWRKREDKWEFYNKQTKQWERGTIK